LPVRFFPARAVLVSGLLAVVLLGACGKDDPASPSASPSAPATSASVTPSAKPSASPSPSKSAKPVAPSNNFDKVTVSGGYGKAPKVAVKSPWAIDKTRSKVLTPNTGGAQVKEGQTVEVNYTGVDGRSGKTFDSSFTRGASIAFNLAQVVPGFSKGLVGQRQGSRVLIAMPGIDGYDSTGGNPQAGIEVGDTLIFVVDLVRVQLSGPEGTPVKPKPGLPTVTVKDGKPEIAVPKTDPPPTLQVQPLIRGNGKKVGENDQITFNYRWVRWNDGKLLEESYSSQPAVSPLSGLLPGMVKGLNGQPVGSRILLVIPPADGYPEGNATPSVKKGETLVMVVDLLFTQAPQ
jgi:peptidylprolyl isomerase